MVSRAWCTLDPFAEGLLLVLSGQTTRLMELLHPLPKTYKAEIIWGQETDTGDYLGPVIFESPKRPSAAELNEVVKGFLGWHEQVPPATSAKKIGGEAAYKKSHRGEIFELKPSRVYLHEAQWINYGLNSSILEVTCRGGFYIRSLARDIGRQVGCFAHLRQLHRTVIGPWKDPGFQIEELIQGESLIPWCSTRYLSEIEADHLAHGRPIKLGFIEEPSWALPRNFPDPSAPIRGIFQDTLIALLRIKGDELYTTANLRGGL